MNVADEITATGPIADAGEAVQRRINQADQMTSQVTDFVHQRPFTAVLIGVAVGYLLGKIT